MGYGKTVGYELVHDCSESTTLRYLTNESGRRYTYIT